MLTGLNGLALLSFKEHLNNAQFLASIFCCISKETNRLDLKQQHHLYHEYKNRILWNRAWGYFPCRPLFCRFTQPTVDSHVMWLHLAKCPLHWMHIGANLFRLTQLMHLFVATLLFSNPTQTGKIIMLLHIITHYYIVLSPYY